MLLTNRRRGVTVDGLDGGLESGGLGLVEPFAGILVGEFIVVLVVVELEL